LKKEPASASDFEIGAMTQIIGAGLDSSLPGQPRFADNARGRPCPPSVADDTGVIGKHGAATRGTQWFDGSVSRVPDGEKLRMSDGAARLSADQAIVNALLLPTTLWIFCRLTL
jgi:hypothetical protein